MSSKGRIPSTAALWVTLLLAAAPTEADVPRLVSYQGRLTDLAGDPLAGPADLAITLYDALTGGAVLFTETHAGVPLTDGVFSIAIGSETVGGMPDSALDAPQVWLGVSVNGEAELVPRTEIGMVPFAAKARSAERLVRPDTFTTAVQVDTAGNVGVGRMPTVKLDVAGQVRGTDSGGNYGYVGGPSHGVYGQAVDTDSAVFGIQENANYGFLGGPSHGVYGYHDGTENVGYLGTATGGAYGKFHLSDNYGYLGTTDEGVFGTTAHPSDFAVRGSNTAAAGTTGYLGGTYGAHGEAEGSGNYGYLGGSYGAYGKHEASGNYGLLGSADNGVFGKHQASQNRGYFGSAEYGAYALHHASGNYGALGTDTCGVLGHSDDGNGVYGSTSTGYAGHFEGPVKVTGHLELPTGAGEGKVLVSDAAGNASWGEGVHVAQSPALKTTLGVPFKIIFEPTTTETLSYVVPAGRTLRVLDFFGWKSGGESGAGDAVTLQNNDGTPADIWPTLTMSWWDGDFWEHTSPGQRFARSGYEASERDVAAGNSLDCVAVEDTNVDCIVVVECIWVEP